MSRGITGWLSRSQLNVSADALAGPAKAVDANVQGRFQALGELGSGGMSSVHDAVDLQLKRRTALKVMHPQLANDAQVRRRFIVEAQVTAQLEHPNIGPLYDVGVDVAVVDLAAQVHGVLTTDDEAQRVHRPIAHEQLCEDLLAVLLGLGHEVALTDEGALAEGELGAEVLLDLTVQTHVPEGLVEITSFDRLHRIDLLGRGVERVVDQRLQTGQDLGVGEGAHEHSTNTRAPRWS